MEGDKKQIWIRIGNYGTPMPFEIYGNIVLEKNDPVINECFQQYKRWCVENNLPIKEPIQVIVRHVVEDEEDYEDEMDKCKR